MGNRSWRGRDTVHTPPRIRPIIVRRPRTNASMRYHHRRIRSDEHRPHRRLQSPLGTEGHPLGRCHPQLECHDCDIDLARNPIRRNPAARHGGRPCRHPFSATERQPAARTQKPVQPQGAELPGLQSHRVNTTRTRTTVQPHAPEPPGQRSHWVDTEGNSETSPTSRSCRSRATVLLGPYHQS